jgi:hypothetical protein
MTVYGVRQRRRNGLAIRARSARSGNKRHAADHQILHNEAGVSFKRAPRGGAANATRAFLVMDGVLSCWRFRSGSLACSVAWLDVRSPGAALKPP